MKTCVSRNFSLLLLFFINVYCQFEIVPWWINSDHYELEIMPVAVENGNNLDLIDEFGNQMSSTVWRTVSNFQCKSPLANSTTLLLYGTKAWSFPIQDVNLTLTYPSENADLFRDPIDEDVDHIITEFKVVLHIDGVEVRGFITEGGMLRDIISLTFVSHDITSLSYQIWLYGTAKENLDSPDPAIPNLCN